MFQHPIQELIGVLRSNLTCTELPKTDQKLIYLLTRISQKKRCAFFRRFFGFWKYNLYSFCSRSCNCGSISSVYTSYHSFQSTRWQGLIERSLTAGTHAFRENRFSCIICSSTLLPIVFSDCMDLDSDCIACVIVICPFSQFSITGSLSSWTSAALPFVLWSFPEGFK